MPADTLNDMILGFSVILGVLLLYVFSLFLRTRKALGQQQKRGEDTRQSQ
jgi:hypothetical protein